MRSASMSVIAPLLERKRTYAGHRRKTVETLGGHELLTWQSRTTEFGSDFVVYALLGSIPSAKRGSP